MAMKEKGRTGRELPKGWKHSGCTRTMRDPSLRRPPAAPRTFTGGNRSVSDRPDRRRPEVPGILTGTPRIVNET